jgi:hypothetical protein
MRQASIRGNLPLIRLMLSQGADNFDECLFQARFVHNSASLVLCLLMIQRGACSRDVPNWVLREVRSLARDQRHLRWLGRGLAERPRKGAGAVPDLLQGYL